MKRDAFTLAEMLIVILLISITLVVMAPAMTKKAKEPVPEVKVIEGTGETMPVGAIILFYGEKIPEGWQECSGQNLDTQGFEELAANSPHYQNLPDLNQIFQNSDLNVKWIIKVKK